MNCGPTVVQQKVYILLTIRTWLAFLGSREGGLEQKHEGVTDYVQDSNPCSKQMVPQEDLSQLFISCSSSFLM